MIIANGDNAIVGNGGETETIGRKLNGGSAGFLVWCCGWLPGVLLEDKRRFITSDGDLGGGKWNGRLLLCLCAAVDEVVLIVAERGKQIEIFEPFVRRAGGVETAQGGL